MECRIKPFADSCLKNTIVPTIRPIDNLIRRENANALIVTGKQIGRAHV